MNGQLPLDTIDLDSLINDVIKPVITLVISKLSAVGFTLGDSYFSFWDLIIVAFVVDVICTALYYKHQENKND